MNLPSLLDVKDTLSKAMAWLRSSEPFLVTCSPLVPASSSLLNVDTLKVLDVSCMFSLQKISRPRVDNML